MSPIEQNYAVVVTTISEPNKALRLIAQKCHEKRFTFYAIGDLKSPDNFSLRGCDFYSTEKQSRLPFRLAKNLPDNHYSRKNLGYLLAMQAGHQVIIETDDDNIPFDSFWDQRKCAVNIRLVEHDGWINVYRFFTQSSIWPRGFPLEFLNASLEMSQTVDQAISQKLILQNCPIQQGLANDNPDVDAIYRMTSELPITFDMGNDVALGAGSWCPFNSQNTAWFKEAFPLMYLPSFCSFRMTDIWRSFIAQRIAWTCNWSIMFCSPTVYQERNEHNLLSDFEQEIPGYLNNAKICTTLSELDLLTGVEHIPENLYRCYQAMTHHQWIDNKKELELLENWIEALHDIEIF